MTITIPREIVRQACVAMTLPYGGRWIQHDIEVQVGDETHLVAVRLEIQTEALISREAEVARVLHNQLDSARAAIRALEQTITGGEFMQGIKPESE